MGVSPGAPLPTPTRPATTRASTAKTTKPTAASPTAQTSQPPTTISPTPTTTHVVQQQSPYQSGPESRSAAASPTTVSPKYRSQNGNDNKEENEDYNHRPHSTARYRSRASCTRLRLIVQRHARILRNHRGHAHGYQRYRSRIIPIA